MKNFTFVVNGTISLHIDVEAETLKQAIEQAHAAPLQSFCHQCSEGEPSEWRTSGELDCDPTASPLVEVIVDGEELDEKALKRAKANWG